MNHPALGADSFSAFFQELWGKDPFPWQKEFARRICGGEWPRYVAVPTGSGKTACLDAAVFALAVQSALPMEERTQGRRIFFIVNRRVIVDEAYRRAGELCKKLELATPDSIVGRVATALRTLANEPGARPLGCAQLRGGIYRDRSWVGSLLQPMIVCSTVDQAGSRLLFRGYGVSAQARPIHAALVAQDSLLILDEAHISLPFVQTLEWVARYREYQPTGTETIRLPFQFIQMTATPPAEVSDADKITLCPEDHEHPVLKPRLIREKLARLEIEEKAKGKSGWEQMADRLAKEAKKILSNHKPNSIAIMVNRVATARSVADKLEKDYPDQVQLLIGRLRPLDRERATQKISERLKTGAAPSDAAPCIVVSTQCLEVGADLDFEALVTEAASLDALRQRFGRLNRAGRDIIARAVIVLPGDQNLTLDKLDEKNPCDPIYGNAIPQTWHWLQTLAENKVVDFGINKMTAAVETFRSTTPEALSAMLSPTTNAPVLLPAYLDCWVQTNPSPAADPDVGLFLNGPQRDLAEVQVCWRADLPEEYSNEGWTDILSLCPPTTAECLPVPLHVFRSWMDAPDEFKDFSGDVAETPKSAEKGQKRGSQGIEALVWRGPRESVEISDIRPSDTIVLRAQSGGWKALGNIPSAPVDPQDAPEVKLAWRELQLLDGGEQGSAKVRRRAVLRIHPALWPEDEKGTAATELAAMARDSEGNWSQQAIQELLVRLLNDENPGIKLEEHQKLIVKHLAGLDPRELSVTPYPDNAGMVISSHTLLSLPGNDDSDNGDMEPEALLETREAQTLCAHTKSVLEHVEDTLSRLPLSQWQEALLAAAELHDWGKADPRFQALLRNTSPFAAMASGVVLAKSGTIPSSAAARHAAIQRAKMPQGFRHEMLSVQMAESETGIPSLPSLPLHRALALHLIATHHGYGRPFAPVVNDKTPPDVSLPIQDKTVALTSAERIEHPAHALDSGIAERFWQLTRHHGWWGIALLETVLRLADQKASANSKS